jgi:hypothetical protein
MKRYLISFVLCTLLFAHFGTEKFARTGDNQMREPIGFYGDGVFIAYIGDIRAILGSQGKNILVCEHGDVIAILYGGPSSDPNNSMLPYVAYSVDTGNTWNIYGPFGGAIRRMYGAVTGPPNFCQIGGIVFAWQENTLGYNDGRIVVVMEENVPYAPSFSVPTILPNSQPPAMYPWEPDIAMAPDDMTNLVATAWSFLANGNEWAYCWISSDHGYTWTDSIPMAFIPQDGACGALACGDDDYVIYTYQDYYSFTPTDSTPYPHYMESTDGGYTWSPETPVPGVPVNNGSQFWWHEFDCYVINSEPWLVHTDIGTPGGGPYIMHGTGSPGNWTWEIWDAGQIGTCSLTIADTTFYCYPEQYPNISHDPVSNTILISYKAFFYKEYAGSIYYNGAHIGGVYTTDNGASWTISQPLSDTNTTQIAWGDWNATEVAHWLANIGGDVWAYGIWVHAIELAIYFERGLVTSFLPLAVNESSDNSIIHTYLQISPSIAKGMVSIEFSLSQASAVEINLYDINGRLVSNIHRGDLNSGHHYINLPTHSLTNGIYFVSVQTGCVAQTKKFALLH